MFLGALCLREALVQIVRRLAAVFCFMRVLLIRSLLMFLIAREGNKVLLKSRMSLLIVI